MVKFALLDPKETDDAFQRSNINTALEEAIYRNAESRRWGTSPDDSYASSGSEDDSDSDYDGDCIEDIAADLATYTECLMDLHTAYDDPASDEEHDKAAAVVAGDVFQPSRYYSDRIAIRFPNADKSLVEKLGSENWKRFLRCQSERNMNSKVHHDTEPAIEAKDPTIVESKFHDSGLGSSRPATTLYAETVTSFYREDGGVVRIPPLPEEGKAGKPFECVVCNKILRISRRAAWK